MPIVEIKLKNGQTLYFNDWQELYHGSPPDVVVYLFLNHVYIDNPDG